MLGFEDVRRYTGGKTDWLASGLPGEGKQASEPRVGALADRHAFTARPDERVGEVRKRMHAAGADACVVVNEQRVVLGLLRGGVLEAAPSVRVDEVMQLGPSTYRPDVSVEEMREHMRAHDVDQVLISSGDGELIGLLDRADVERNGPVLATSARQED